ncbi:uncharacterized protein CIMG_13409 [Coccidioides immitis RS]|uniref:Uncharacterized protein n=1 Tax=Coccidioides immitis (strain RS) TaxID=246410 RepID=J3KEN4_COCIM|nr:uncharacterized protein CIMG_13409 [Coccidioides immitis RS]EAS33963.3 hypothetical protein CIMG_13409 [Coccidioides immitis RS]
MFTPYSIYLYKGHQPPKLVNIDHPVAKAVAIPNPCVLLLNLSIIRAILILEEDHQGFVSVQAESHRVKVVEEVQSSLMESDSLQARFEAIFPKLVILCSGSSRDPCIDEEDRGALGLGMECLMGAPDTLVVAEPFWEAAAGYGLTFEGLMKPVALNSSPELRIHTDSSKNFAGIPDLFIFPGDTAQPVAHRLRLWLGGQRGSWRSQKQLSKGAWVAPISGGSAAGELGLCRPAHSSHVLALVAGQHLHMYHGGAALCSLAARSLSMDVFDPFHPPHPRSHPEQISHCNPPLLNQNRLEAVSPTSLLALEIGLNQELGQVARSSLKLDPEDGTFRARRNKEPLTSQLIWFGLNHQPPTTASTHFSSLFFCKSII